MKKKPVFKNNTKGRIQIVQQGIPIWLNPGDTIVGERFRPFMKLGLEEVGREALTPKKLVAPVVNDPEPEKAPVKVREMKVVDMVIPHDEIKVEPTPVPEPEAEDILPLDPEELEEEPVLALELTSTGEALKDEIVSDILSDLDDEPVIILEDDEDDIKLEEPDDYPFKCDQCDRSFASSRGLKSHKRVHND